VQPLDVALVRWQKADEISDAIGYELRRLGHRVHYFHYDAPIPSDANLVLTFAPYNRFIQIPHQLAALPPTRRPLFVHWNTENPPDLRIPWFIVKPISAWRTWLGKVRPTHGSVGRLSDRLPLAMLHQRMAKFRYVGDAHYTYQQGWVHAFFDCSEIYSAYHRRHGLPSAFVPFGTMAGAYADLQLERDIDVLWLGKRRTRRRHRLLERLRAQLSRRGVRLLVVDGVEHPLIYGALRTQILNRAKLTLNLLPTWYDCCLLTRFHMAAPNRSLVLGEPSLPHSSQIRAGEHYVAAPIAELAGAIQHFLTHTAEREDIVARAYDLTTTQLTLANSVKTLLTHVQSLRHEVATSAQP